MKIIKRASSILCLLVFISTIKAAYFEKMPFTISQPDGQIISCFISGDEFFSWIHDLEGFTFVQSPDGYYYYAEQDGDLIRPSKYLVNSINPADVGLRKWIIVSKKEYQRLRDETISYDKLSKGIQSANLCSGTWNNLVVYIRFADDSEFTTTREIYDNKFNSLTSNSLKSYFNEVSYNKLTINSTHYPACPLTTNLSYQDVRPRKYFLPYNATTNPIGYQGNEIILREKALLADAINWINTNSPVPSSINIDIDGNNMVDNVSFIVKGGKGNALLGGGAHLSILSNPIVYINEKQVFKYTFQPEELTSISTLCHEMFHLLGAVDLYHQFNIGGIGLGISPASPWDIMDYGSGHMLAYMKWKYTNHVWISTIPEITTSGTYTLNPVTSHENNCYKIASPNSSHEYFIVEYRKKAGKFEIELPGSGLIVYRIDTTVCCAGNAGGPPDEVYVYRPDGTITVDGISSDGYLSSSVGRTAINDATNPSCFLQDGSPGGLDISNVTAAESTISFKVSLQPSCTPPTMQASFLHLSSISETTMTANWTRGNGDGVLVLGRAGGPVNAGPTNGITYIANSAFASGAQIGADNYVIYNGTGTYVNITGMNAETTYYFAVYEYNSEGYCYKRPALTESASTNGASAYCSAGSNNACCEYISNFVLGSINQISERGTAGYQDFTSQNTTLQIGENAAATITVTNPRSSDRILIWIDWNKDNDFTDAGENLYSSTISFTSPHTTMNFAIPAEALPGTTRMRIRLHSASFGPNITPCGNSLYGEVEDYSINITSPTCTTPISQATSFTSSAITRISMNTSWIRGNGDAVLVVARAGYAVNSAPANGTNYSASTTFGSGSQIGSGNYVIYNGTGTSVNLTGLEAGTAYFFAIYEYNFAGFCYKTPALKGNATTICTPIITSLSQSNVTAGGSDFWFYVNGAGFIPTSEVLWNGSKRTSGYNGTTQLTAIIPASDISTAGTVNITVFNPTPCGGTSGTRTFTINNPVPLITSLSSVSETAGGPTFTLTINGLRFVSTSVVRWNNSNRTTTFVNSTQLTILITASDIVTAETASITVFNPTPGGGTSSPAKFTINNPFPLITSLSPKTLNAGDPFFTLTINGTGFVPGSVAWWNNSNRPTTFFSNRQLTTSIPASAITTPGTASITVFNPPPGGGTSSPSPFTIKDSGLPNGIILSGSESFSVFPNPVQNVLHVNLSGMKGELQIFNIFGECVLKKQIIENENSIDVSNLEIGIYFIKLMYDKEISTLKIVKY